MRTYSDHNTRGFTLIELLVVIAIIGVLSSVVLASLNSARIKARDARRISDMHQVQTALELYYNDNKGYPPAVVGTVLSGLVNFAPKHIPVIPNDPVYTGSAGYRYCRPTTNSYTILVNLEGDAPQWWCSVRVNNSTCWPESNSAYKACKY
jgi:prepilin-type N-terminal cleavage/methylation domain-containing protein